MRELQMEGGSGDPGPLGLFLAGRPGKPGTPMLSKSYSYNPAFKYFGLYVCHSRFSKYEDLK